MGTQVIRFIDTFLFIVVQIYSWLIIVRVILSWIRTRPNRFTEFVVEITEPVLKIAKKITPKIGMIDLSPIVAFIGIELLYKLLESVLVFLSPYIIQLLG